MVSRHVVELCTSHTTLTATLAKDPRQPISRIVKQLFKNRSTKSKKRTSLLEEDELDLVAKCGSFPHRPSDLFLLIYKDVLRVLETNPLAGLVSPSLLGSSGVVPLTIVSVIPDITRHYANLIARAETEVLFATNYWELSKASGFIADSLRELSRRVQARGGEEVVVKLMYDRGNVKQAVKSRIVVQPIFWTRIGLPAPNEIPGVSLEVINYHRALLGTFHAKYLVVDRRVACINSNNIQDRPNLEMMIQLEGPVVDSFYDMALMSWATAMNPPLPLLSIQPTYPGVYQFKQDNESLKYIGSEPKFTALRAHFQEWRTGTGSTTADQRHRDAISRPEEQVTPSPKTTDARAHGNFDTSPKDYERDEVVEKPRDTAVPSRKESATTKTNTNDLVSTSMRSHSPISDSNSRGVDNGLVSSSETAELLDAGEVDSTTQDADDDFLADFFPHILHEPHIPVPIAMVNRRPTGTPGHYHVRHNPQDVAWLSAMRNAQKSVFIQTPTFNATPIVSGALYACRRGVRVTLYLDLGFNDQGEMIPFQGGTNEEVVHNMYRKLNREGKGAEKCLEVFWYTAIDQTKPLDAALRKRNCHDTQSWFHSQEINVMIDSRELVGAWMRGIETNQNTRLYGRVSDRDGVLRGQDGEAIQASGVEASNFLSRLKGMGKVMSRVRGTGGF
ncbi:hypothetical protein EI94DRAFT_1737335 [Lactarius quietus]|nr:hypothetical protein EI94DRAFT_1737335 [Lactarius quietus]